MLNTIQKVDEILQHIKKVESNCKRLGKKLILNGNEKLGLLLIANSRLHDLSKFDDYEFAHLWKDDPKFEIALASHRQRNKHHPEYYPSIQDMPTLYIAEMVCDCVARAQEFGANVRDWFEQVATVKYNFSMEESVGKAITEYLDLLLTRKFT